jgi:hypothetical protein
MTNSSPAVATTSLSWIPWPAAVMMRRAQDRFGEHGISQRGPGNGPGDLAGHHGGGHAEAVAARGTAAQQPVRGGDDRVEMRTAGRDEDDDQDSQAKRGHHRVDQQPQRAVPGQPGDRDARPDHDGDEQARAGELGQQPPAYRCGHGLGLVTVTLVRPVAASQVPTMLAAISVRFVGSHSKMASARARASSAVIEAGLGEKLCCCPSAVTIITSNRPSSPSGPAVQLALST